MVDIPIEHELIKQAAALVDLKVIDTQIDRFVENTRVRITMQEDPEVLVRHLRFPKGPISLYADYVHGRVMKTSIEVSLDGKVVLETVNRGEAATRWVARLQGKKVVSLVGSQPTESIE